MKSILLLLVGLCLLSADISAQITLHTTDYAAAVTGTDSLEASTYTSLFPGLPAIAGGSWDMSVVTDTTSVDFIYRIPGIGTYEYADSNTYNFAGYSYHGNVESGITSTGILEYAIDVLPAAYNISSLTLGASDSLFIPAQTSLYTSPRTKLILPALYNSSWTSVYHTDLDFLLSVSIFSYDHTPGIVRTYTTETDSITGWGQMRVKDITGSPSAYWNVLQVRSTIINTDSFLVSGVPASPSLLLTLSLTQGAQDTSYIQSYYRIGEVTPLAEVKFKDASFTTPASAKTHVQRLIHAPNSVPTLANEVSVKVYPNPAIAGESLSVSLPAAKGSWSYELLDITGKVIAKDILVANGSSLIALPVSVVRGIYYMKVSRDGKQFCIKAIDIN